MMTFTSSRVLNQVESDAAAIEHLVKAADILGTDTLNTTGRVGQMLALVDRLIGRINQTLNDEDEQEGG
jgi:hypothetical protein